MLLLYLILVNGETEDECYFELKLERSFVLGRDGAGLTLDYFSNINFHDPLVSRLLVRMS